MHFRLVVGEVRRVGIGAVGERPTLDVARPSKLVAESSQCAFDLSVEGLGCAG